MHIASAQIENVFRLHLHKVGAANVSPVSATRQPDSITLSCRATEIGSIRQYMDRLPDVRHDKVEEFRQAVDSGAYIISEFDLASAIIAGTSRGVD